MIGGNSECFDVLMCLFLSLHVFLPHDFTKQFNGKYLHSCLENNFMFWNQVVALKSQELKYSFL